MKVKGVLVALSIIVIAGCVPSLHQLYTDKTLVFDDTVVGTFNEKDGKSVWKFVGDAENKSYAVTINESENKQSKLTGHLVKAGDSLFFDFYPSDDAELEGGDWVKFHVIPVHLFFKVDKTAGGLSLAAMNPDAIDKLLKEKPDLIKHERVEDDRVVLTDSPEKLQTFLLEGLKVKDFFGEPMELTRATQH